MESDSKTSTDSEGQYAFASCTNVPYRVVKTSQHNKEEGISLAEVQELSLLLETRTFVDYFNIYLCLPVFGQHVLYKYIENEFEFEPPIRDKKNLYLDRGEILRWLCKERFRSFKQSPMYVEYKLCMKLRGASIELEGFPIKDDKNWKDRETFIRNVIGSATGMLLFRESMRGACGANVYECWKDLHVWKQIDDVEKRIYRKYSLKNKYISPSSLTELKTPCKCIVYQGQVNFDLVPAMDADGKPAPDKWRQPAVLEVDSDEALTRLHDLLLEILRDYWLPRHFCKLLQTTSKETIDRLRRPAPRDFEYLDQERKLRCRLMFPSVAMSCHKSRRVRVASAFGSRSVQDQGKKARGSRRPEVSDLLSLVGGPTPTLEVKPKTRDSLSSLMYDEESEDELGKRRILTPHLGYAPDPIPDVLTSFMGGKKRTRGVEEFPNLGNRVVWSLASDTLACSPFRMYLEEQEQYRPLKYLCFWTDMRNYLDFNQKDVDGFGRSIRKYLAEKIQTHYLTSGDDAMFAENLRLTVSKTLDNGTDAPILFQILDLVQESLWQSLTDYFSHERRMFLIQVRGRRFVKKYPVKNKSTVSNERTDLPQTFSSSMIEPESLGTVYSGSVYRSASSAKSADPTARVYITEEQLWKAMELTVLCAEYGNTKMEPGTKTTADALIAVLYNDYGSLYINRVAAQRQPWLQHLMNNRPIIDHGDRYVRKIDIASLKVSKKVFLEKVDIAELKLCSSTNVKTRYVRRNSDHSRPTTRPTSFTETMMHTAYFESFKRFMAENKSGFPVLFWKAVEDLKYSTSNKARQKSTAQILTKYFGPNGDFGDMLECDDNIIKEIPNMDRVTPGILICAQAAVFKSMEEKWFPAYCDTFPTEAEEMEKTRSANLFAKQSAELDAEPQACIADIAITKVSKPSRKKTKMQKFHKPSAALKHLVRSLIEFNRALKNPHECQMLALFVKCEMERERENMQPERLPSKERKGSLPDGPYLMVRGKLVSVPKLPADFTFWLEVLKYQSMVDNANRKGYVTAIDSELLYDKARSIIVCYLNSEVPPKIQVNVPPQTAMNIIVSLGRYGAQRGLFHEALLYLFPILYHYYSRYVEEWVKGKIPAEYIENLERALKGSVCETPHQNVITPDYTDIQTEDMIETVQSSTAVSEGKITFSLAGGAILVTPQVIVNKTPPVRIKSMTKESAINILHHDQASPLLSITTDGKSKKGKHRAATRNDLSTGKRSNQLRPARSTKSVKSSASRSYNNEDNANT